MPYKFLRFLLFAFLVASPALAAGEGTQDAMIQRAVFAEGRIWLLSNAGRISSISEAENTRERETFPNEVVGLCALKGQAIVITGYPEGGVNWTFRKRSKSGWLIVRKIPTLGDRLVGVECASTRITLVTSRRLIDVEEKRQHVVALSGEADVSDLITLEGTQDNLYIGRNAGEWGGGLVRVDRRTGRITTIDKDKGCGGVLRPSCLPVNAIAVLPWKPDCVAVALGLVHMQAKGRVVEVCGDEPKLLYSRTLDLDSQAVAAKLVYTDPIFGLIRDGDSLLAAGGEGLYRIDKNGGVHQLPQPQYKEIAGVYVSFDVPGAVIILTEINRQRSVSGASPILLIAR